MQISDELAERLDAVARFQGINQAEIVEQAIDRFLGLEGDPGDANPLLERLHSIADQLNRIERNLKIVNEVAALHVRYHLAVTPLLPRSKQRAACQLGFDRFEVLAEQVGRRVEQDRPIVQETISRLGAAKFESCREDRATSDVAEQHTTVAAKAESELAAVAQEGDGYGNFRGGLQNPFR